MNRNLIFLPVLAQVLLTLGVYVYLGVAKAKALKLGQVDLQRRALHEDAWPDSVRQVSNNIRNQFETPVLFYALVFVLWGLQAVNAFSLTLAGGYFLARLAHAYVHLGSNYVPWRRRIFTISCLLLVGMILLAVSVLWQG
jgi:hypothetical protein